MSSKTIFKLRRPCENCPFRKEGAIKLARGRLDGIVEHLIRDDHSTFQCHKTVHNTPTGGEWDDNAKKRGKRPRKHVCGRDDQS
ncbi:hypothetical protein [Burkholderia pyrrocinia]|uniref:hypothetical protein n=1 Tax=Burkholderia pyrrocinia TaxID=60550 RepID=UPI001FC8D0A2|nr:hypothetical protein [Burkholderia pyrrocinia]